MPGLLRLRWRYAAAARILLPPPNHLPSSSHQAARSSYRPGADLRRNAPRAGRAGSELESVQHERPPIGGIPLSPAEPGSANRGFRIGDREIRKRASSAPPRLAPRMDRIHGLCCTCWSLCSAAPRLDMYWWSTTRYHRYRSLATSPLHLSGVYEEWFI
ncbi:uncharacterized protein [Zea mays]|uniref:uncharacterized protein isoform X2 n=1 Tax=Zea mays TaxID=4577 RepID=UPI0016525B8A|nr:uncharacterized protein LOC103647926 isoform X2 [Zea mays]